MKFELQPKFAVGDEVILEETGLAYIVTHISFVGNLICYTIKDSFGIYGDSIREYRLTIAPDNPDDPLPMQDEVPELESLRDELEDYIEYLSKGSCFNCERERSICNAAITAFYGNDIWGWMSKQQP